MKKLLILLPVMIGIYFGVTSFYSESPTLLKKAEKTDSNSQNLSPLKRVPLPRATASKRPITNKISPKFLTQSTDPRLKSVLQLIEDERWESAALALMDILKSEPNHEQALLAMGYLYVRDPKYSYQGVLMLQKVLRINPENDFAMGELLQAMEAGKAEGLSQAIEKAYRENPESSNLAAGLGWIRFREEKFPEAISLLEKATHDDTFAESSYHSLIDAYLATGNHSKIAETFSRLIAFQQESLERAKTTAGKEAERLERAIVTNQLELAKSLLALGQRENAATILREVRESKSRPPEWDDWLKALEAEAST